MNSRANVLLYGLEDQLAEELRTVLDSLRQSVVAVPDHGSECQSVLRRTPADLVFGPAHPEQLQELLHAVEQLKPGLPVVAVSREAEVSHWLDALEAGAADYCSAPFERTQVGWILQTKLGMRPIVAAATS